MNCPCHSGKPYQKCCASYILGELQAPDPERLMRSRYSAYVLNEMAYIETTWHPDYRPSRFDAEQPVRWIGLKVIATSPPRDQMASVEFEARLLQAGRVEGLHEKSQFVFSDGRWLYTRGEQLPLTFNPWKPGRNETCPCGSGRKFKRCCGA